MIATEQEHADRASVIKCLKEAISTGSTVSYPRPAHTSLFSACVGLFRYIFEGEDDLLHLQVERTDGGKLTVDEGREVAQFVLSGVPQALIWMKTGHRSQHFYIGHDDLVDSIDD